MSAKTFSHGKYTVTVESTESNKGSWSSAISLAKDGADVLVHLARSGRPAWPTDAEAILAGITKGLVYVNRDNESASDRFSDVAVTSWRCRTFENGVDYWPFLRDVDDILRRYGSRPHWGKLHFTNRDDVDLLFRKAAAFRELRRSADPEGFSTSGHFLAERLLANPILAICSK
jgi:hypothetical protein